MSIQAAPVPVQSGPARILPFTPRPRPDGRDAETVAAVLLAMEGFPLATPVIVAARGLDGVHYVGASIAGRAFRLTPAEARLAADALWADPGEPGFAETAARFRDAADAADRAFLRRGA